jgi:hypothetical protein
MSLQLIKRQVTNRVTMIGDWIAGRQVRSPLVGSRYLYENRTPPGAAIGTIYHNAGEGELYINSQDLDGNNHYNVIGSLNIGDKLTVGTQTAALILRPAYVGGGLWQLFFASWPPLVNGEYLVSVERP